MADSEAMNKSYYNQSISRPKDLSVMSQRSAGVHKDSVFGAKQLKEELLAHSFKVGHRQEPDAYHTANAKFLKKHDVDPNVTSASKA